MCIYVHSNFCPVAVRHVANCYIRLLYFTLLCVQHIHTGFGFYSVHNARIASAVLATAIPSVCLSVTRRFCVKTTTRSTVQYAPLDSKMCLVL